MCNDPVVEEIHRIRDEQAKKLHYDLHAICEDAKAKEVASGRRVISRSPRKSVVNDAA